MENKVKPARVVPQQIPDVFRCKVKLDDGKLCGQQVARWWFPGTGKLSGIPTCYEHWEKAYANAVLDEMRERRKGLEREA